MTTLKDLKKQQGLTNKDIGKRLGVSASVAGMVIQGRYIRVYHDEQIQRLADILGVTFERCWFAMQASYAEFMGSVAPEQRADELRAEVQAEMQITMPDLGIEIQVPRQLATVDSFIVAPALQLSQVSKTK